MTSLASEMSYAKVVKPLVEFLQAHRHVVRQVIRTLDTVHDIARRVGIRLARLQPAQDFRERGLERAKQVVSVRRSWIEVRLPSSA